MQKTCKSAKEVKEPNEEKGDPVKKHQYFCKECNGGSVSPFPIGRAECPHCGSRNLRTEE